MSHLKKEKRKEKKKHQSLNLIIHRPVSKLPTLPNTLSAIEGKMIVFFPLQLQFLLKRYTRNYHYLHPSPNKVASQAKENKNYQIHEEKLWL